MNVDNVCETQRNAGIVSSKCFTYININPSSTQDSVIISKSHMANSHWLSILHMVLYRFPCYSLHTSHPFLPSKHVHKSFLYVCISSAALQIGSSVSSV